MRSHKYSDSDGESEQPIVTHRHGPDGYSVSHDTGSGIRIRMVRRCTRQKMPSVRQLIDTLAMKHEHLLLEEIRQRSHYIAKCSKNQSLPSESYTNGFKASLSSTNIDEIDLVRPTLRCKQHRDNFRKTRMKLSNSVDRSWDNHFSNMDAHPIHSPAMHVGSVPQTNLFPQSRVNNHLKMNGIRTALVSKSTDSKVRKSDDETIATGTTFQGASDTAVDSSSSFPASSTRRLPLTSPHKPLQLSSIKQSYPHAESEPRYGDAMIGGSSSYHQRVGELALHEAETVRWERSRRARRKAKQERDS